MDFLQHLHIESSNKGISTGSRWLDGKGGPLSSHSPVDGKLIGTVSMADRDTYDAAIAQAEAAFLQWRTWPAPRRGEVVRLIGEALRAHKDDLGKLVSYEMGKSLQEGWGEVQE